MEIDPQRRLSTSEPEKCQEEAAKLLEKFCLHAFRKWSELVTPDLVRVSEESQTKMPHGSAFVVTFRSASRKISRCSKDSQWPDDELHMLLQ